MVVFVVAAELRQRVRDLGFLLGHDIAPNLAVRQLLLGGNRAVGVDVITGVDEEVRPIVEHGAIAAVPPRDVSMPQPCPAVSPDWMPLAICGLSAARLRCGFASAATARLEVERTRNCRRVQAREARSDTIQETFVESRRKVPASFDSRLTVS